MDHTWRVTPSGNSRSVFWWLAASIRKAKGTSNTSATSTGLGVSERSGDTKPTTGVIR